MDTCIRIRTRSSPEISKEMFSSGLSIIELFGIHLKVLKELRTIEAKNQKLLFQTTLKEIF